MRMKWFWSGNTTSWVVELETIGTILNFAHVFASQSRFLQNIEYDWQRFVEKWSTVNFLFWTLLANIGSHYYFSRSRYIQPEQQLLIFLCFMASGSMQIVVALLSLANSPKTSQYPGNKTTTWLVKVTTKVSEQHLIDRPCVHMLSSTAISIYHILSLLQKHWIKGEFVLCHAVHFSNISLQKSETIRR